MKKIILWEILVPTHFNNHKKISLYHHKKWDTFVENLTGGLTIQKTSKGIWRNENRKTFEESMIPVKVACSKKEMNEIVNFTAKHYGQEAVLFYLVSPNVKIVKFNKKFQRK